MCGLSQVILSSLSAIPRAEDLLLELVQSFPDMEAEVSAL